MIRRLLVAVALGLCLPMSVAAQESVEYYGTDAIGSMRIVFDANGNVLGRMDYGPFGEQLSASTVRHKSYAGLFRDGEAGLDYAEARSYQVRTGRFSAPDPVYAGLFSPQLWNRYAYAANTPISLTDSTGLYIEDAGQNFRPEPFRSGTEGDLSSLLLSELWLAFGHIRFGGLEGTQRAWSSFAINWENIPNRIDKAMDGGSNVLDAVATRLTQGGECLLPEHICDQYSKLGENLGTLRSPSLASPADLPLPH